MRATDGWRAIYAHERQRFPEGVAWDREAEARADAAMSPSGESEIERHNRVLRKSVDEAHAFRWKRDASRPEIQAHLRAFRGLVLDADGVLFDGKETRGVASIPSGLLDVGPSDRVVISKTRDFRDGQGISFLRAMGIRILFASGEGEPLGSIVRKMNELPSCKSGAWAPVECMTELKQGKDAAVACWASRHRVDLVNESSLASVVYVGDDRTDCEAMAMVSEHGGLVVIPVDAQRVVRKYAGLVLTKPGGAGAIREFAELVCDARGIDEEGLATA